MSRHFNAVFYSISRLCLLSFRQPCIFHFDVIGFEGNKNATFLLFKISEPKDGIKEKYQMFFFLVSKWKKKNPYRLIMIKIVKITNEKNTHVRIKSSHVHSRCSSVGIASVSPLCVNSKNVIRSEMNHGDIERVKRIMDVNVCVCACVRITYRDAKTHTHTTNCWRIKNGNKSS